MSFHHLSVLSHASAQHGAREEVNASPRLLHQIFERQAALTPDALAVVCGKACRTYSELEQRANQIARILRQYNVGKGCCVGILLPRSEFLYEVILGVLKSGAAYVPLDPGYPAERVAFILEDCQAGVLVTCRDLASKAQGFRGTALLLEQIESELHGGPLGSFLPPDAHVEPHDLSYIIYTSGTTGRPKGVQIEHRSIVHLVEAERRIFQVEPTDRVFQGFSIAFDASLEEIWLAFSCGATLVVGTSEMMRSGPALSQLLEQAGVTVLSCVPTLLSVIEQDVPSLRLLILGGEVCPPELVKRWCKAGRRVFNTYGPTEATVIATYVECSPDVGITIGRPLPGYDAVVVDTGLSLAAPGTDGELMLGGVGLARGYVGQPELTAQKFFCRSYPGVEAQRFYRTGDRVRWTSTGELEFLGRLDSQIKIRGFRVELSEIESVLLECPELKSAAVSLSENGSGVQQLVAYVVPRSGVNVETHKLSAQLRERLPPYMLPAIFEMVPSLPTLPSGKVDRHALPAPRARRKVPEVSRPSNDLELQLVSTWARLFSVPAVSTHDDFFLDLGGHSLTAARMVSELRRSPAFCDLSMADVYTYPTPSQLAGELHRRNQTRSTHSCESAARSSVGSPERIQPGAQPDPQLGNEQNRTAESVHCFQPVPSWRHFWCGLGQLVSLVFVLSFFALQWLAPYLTYTVLIEEEYDFLTALLAAFASLVLLYPVMLLLTIGLKWLIIGRYRPGRYPLWGWYHFRFWLATSIEATVPVSYLTGTPLLSIYLRLMGAKIGRNVFLQTDNFAIYDLLSIGDDSSVNAEASLLGYSVSRGYLQIGRITVGHRCFLGTRSSLGLDSSMADDSTLGDLSLLQTGQAIGLAENWIGSPARRHVNLDPEIPKATNSLAAAPSKWMRVVVALLHTLGLLAFPVLVVGALFPGIALMNRLNYIDPYYWYLFLSPLVGASFVGLLCLEIVVLKWLLLGRIQPGRHRLQSWYYLRKWFVDKTLELSLDVVGPLYASVYLAPWYKLLGAKLGRGAEISTASFISPDLLTIGEESFVADNASLGAPRVERGFLEVGTNRIGRRSFIGNSALLPPGAEIGDEVLIGCLSAPPEKRADALRPDTAWLGSPALFLKQRLKSDKFDEQTTFNPSWRVRAVRAAIEFVRVISPSTGFIILISLLFSGLLLLHDRFSLVQTLLFFPVLYLGCGWTAAAITIVAKWCLIGRYRPGEKPLWSSFVWRNELINALHEHLAGPFLVGALAGTPFISWYFRLLGAQIGRRAYIDTTDFSEFDLARIGDDAALNTDCTVQTHLFEDRVMKMDFVQIGPRCSVGANSVVLYDTRMEPGSELDQLSLLMKGETLPSRTSWAGSPARTSAS